MGKKIQSSQPLVFDTVLPPLSDTFEIVPSDTIVQWYNTNKGYKPDREVTALLLTPHVSAYDKESGDVYNNLQFVSVTWYKLTNGSWVQVPSYHTQDIPSTGDYVPSDGNTDFHMVCRTNAPISSGGGSPQQGGLTYKCRASYQDPRSGVESPLMETTILLTANVDSSITNPTLELMTPSTFLYNPITNQSSLFTFNVRALLGTQALNVYFEWYACIGENEVLINTLPCYKEATQPTGKGQGTDTIVLNAMYADQVNVMVKAKETQSSSTYYISKAYATLMWSDVPVEVIAATKNGVGIGSTDRLMTLTNIINLKGTNPRTLNDAEKLANFIISWKYRLAINDSTGINPQNPPATILLGTGQEMPVDSNDLRVPSKINSRLVWIEAEFLGANQEVTCNNEVVTSNNETVYCRN